MVRICVIVLVGLPASGKTTFCKHILQTSDEFNYIHMCYDEMFSFLPQCSTVTFKEERRKVFQKIEQIIDCIKSHNYPVVYTRGVTISKYDSSKDFVIISDDNSYYAGMRYKMYKMCKEQQLAFGQIYFAVDLQDAVSRNSMRGGSALPISVIELMNKRLDKPSKKNQWERNTFTVQNLFDLEQLHAFFKMCIDNPLTSISIDKETSNQKLNLIHEIDIILRKRIKELLQRTDGDLSKRAQVLNERRKLILLGAKKREITELDLNVDSLVGQLLSD